MRRMKICGGKLYYIDFAHVCLFNIRVCAIFKQVSPFPSFTRRKISATTKR